MTDLFSLFKSSNRLNQDKDKNSHRFIHLSHLIYIQEYDSWWQSILSYRTTLKKNIWKKAKKIILYEGLLLWRIYERRPRRYYYMKESMKALCDVTLIISSGCYLYQSTYDLKTSFYYKDDWPVSMFQIWRGAFYNDKVWLYLFYLMKGLYFNVFSLLKRRYFYAYRLGKNLFQVFSTLKR